MKIPLIIPDPDPDDVPKPGEPPPKVLLISPEGATPGREVPGFFIITIDGDHVLSETTMHEGSPLPRQFLSLDAVNAYLDERYGTAPPLHVRQYLRITRNGPTDFPAIWNGTRGKGKGRKQVTVRYMGSFRYWDGRRVDPTKVGTPREFN